MRWAGLPAALAAAAALMAATNPNPSPDPEPEIQRSLVEPLDAALGHVRPGLAEIADLPPDHPPEP